MNEITVALSGLKAAFDLTKGLVGVRDQAVFQAQLIQLQQAILEAQASTTAARAEQDRLQDEARALRRKIEELEDWKADTARYSLRQVGQGVTLYALGEGEAGPAHFLCPACFNAKRKSIVQKTQETRHGDYFIHRCPSCSAAYEFEERPWGGTAQSYSSDYDLYGDLDK